MTRRINQEGLTLIKRFEGLKTKAYIWRILHHMERSR